MNWKALAKYKCPMCGSFLYLYTPTNKHKCTDKECVFVIGKEKFDEIVGNMFENRTVRMQDFDNSEELNNLGRDVISEDFSDNQPNL